MESLTTAISVQIDSHDKEVASSILKKLGLNMSTYVNMAIKQLINKDGVPLKLLIQNQIENYLKHYKKGKIY